MAQFCTQSFLTNIKEVPLNSEHSRGCELVSNKILYLQDRSSIHPNTPHQVPSFGCQLKLYMKLMSISYLSPMSWTECMYIFLNNSMYSDIVMPYVRTTMLNLILHSCLNILSFSKTIPASYPTLFQPLSFSDVNICYKTCLALVLCCVWLLTICVCECECFCVELDISYLIVQKKIKDPFCVKFNFLLLYFSLQNDFKQCPFSHRRGC